MKPSSRDQASGHAKVASGHVKSAIGKLVGNDRLAAKGESEKIEGRVRQKTGDVKKVFGK
jgi:uncharacterized protein YjbJ (UPF0337 family)